MFLLFGRKLQSTLRDPNSQIRSCELRAGTSAAGRPGALVVARQFAFLGGAWTVILVLIYLLGGREHREMLLWLGPLGYVGISAMQAHRSPTCSPGVLLQNCL